MAEYTKVVGNDVYAGGVVIATLRDVNRFSDTLRSTLDAGLRVDEFAGDEVEVLEARVEDLEDHNRELSREVDDLQDEVSELEKTIADLEARLESQPV